MTPINNTGALKLDRPYSAVLFDMDGTLVDSRLVVERVWEHWAKLHNDNDAEIKTEIQTGDRNGLQHEWKPWAECSSVKISSCLIPDLD